MTTNSSDNYSEVVERNKSYKNISNMFNKTILGYYDKISDEDIEIFVESLKLLRNEMIQEVLKYADGGKA